MNKKFSAVVLVAAMVCVSFSIISLNVNVVGEAVTGPFDSRNAGYPVPSINVDQEQDSFTTNMLSNYMGQSFKAGVTGDLVAVEVDLSLSSGSGTLFIEIWNAVGDLPSGGPLVAPETLSIIGLPDGWQYITLSTPIPLVSGNQYAIVIDFMATSLVNWRTNTVENYPEGIASVSSDGSTWNPQGTGYDRGFRTYMLSGIAGLKKVAWHSSGNYALAVTGVSSEIWKFTRETGQWNPETVLDADTVLHDIIFDDYEQEFYMVGEHTSSGYARAYSHVDGGAYVLLGGPSGTIATFYGVTTCNGISGYNFIAVGMKSGGYGYAAWYSPGVGWMPVTTGWSPSYPEQLNAVTWDRRTDASAKWFGVGSNDDGVGFIYEFYPVGTTNAILKYSTPDNLEPMNAISWCPKWNDGPVYDYALIATSQYIGDGNVYKFDGGGLPSLISNKVVPLYDVDWYPDGEMAVLVGGMASGVVYHHQAGSNEVVPLTGLVPTGTGPLYGVACKGPTSPASAIILGSGGAVAAYPQASDTGTQLRVSSAFPHIFSIDMWDQSTAVGLTGPSLMNTQVDPEGNYTFFIEANYTVGGVDQWWNSTSVDLTAWYDQGILGVGGSNVPDTTWTADDERTRQFRIIIVPGGGSMMWYPMGFPNEFGIHSFYAHPGTFGANHHRLYINVSFKAQSYAADGGGFFNGAAADITNIGLALNDAGSWDFNLTVYDSGFPTAQENAYEEFGIKQAVSISVTGNPAGTAPPGSTNVPLSPGSTITYSSNAQYWVNVSVPDLLLNGVGPENILATNVQVLNANPWNATSSAISGWTAFTGPGVDLVVWGAPALPLPPVRNGTVSAGLHGSDYTWAFTGGAYPYTTLVNWRVSIPITPEGVYYASILFTVEGW